jgi:hypothetical protein
MKYLSRKRWSLSEKSESIRRARKSHPKRNLQRKSRKSDHNISGNAINAPWVS